MKSLAVLLGLALLMIAVQAGPFADRSENEKHADDDLTGNGEWIRTSKGGHEVRHRRKRYGYDYTPHILPPHYPYYFERRDSDRNQELITQIWRLLDEISTNMRRPPQPQPIYVPYPVPYPVPVPQNCTCNVQVNPEIKGRFPELDDTNRNWGISGNTNSQEDYEDDGSDGSRPISFDPITPKSPMARPQPEVEHGSSQSSSGKEERAPSAVPAPSKGTGTCNAAILNCCSEASKQQAKACFTRLGCAMTFAKGNGCSRESIAAAIEAFRRAYSPA